MTCVFSGHIISGKLSFISPLLDYAEGSGFHRELCQCTCTRIVHMYVHMKPMLKLFCGQLACLLVDGICTFVVGGGP